MDPAEGCRLTVNVHSRELRRRLRPLTWAVLEDVLLDATVDEGCLVAATSVRRVAAQVGIGPGSAAAAMRRLRELGVLVPVAQGVGPAGRFGLSAYVVVAPAGVVVGPAPGSRPCGDRPCTAEPCVVEPCTEDRYAAGGERSAPAVRATVADGSVPVLAAGVADQRPLDVAGQSGAGSVAADQARRLRTPAGESVHPVLGLVFGEDG